MGRLCEREGQTENYWSREEVIAWEDDTDHNLYPFIVAAHNFIQITDLMAH